MFPFLEGGAAGDDLACETAEGGTELSVDPERFIFGVAGVISTVINGRGDFGDLSPAEGLVGLTNVALLPLVLLAAMLLFSVVLICGLSAGFAGSSPPPSSSMPPVVVAPLVACVVEADFEFWLLLLFVGVCISLCTLTESCKVVCG